MVGPHPAVAAQRVAVRRVLQEFSSPYEGAQDAPGAREPLVLVACSGGADSLALAAATAFEAPRAGLRAGGVVVDHGLQPGSDQVAARVASTLTALGLDPVRVVAVEVGTAGGPEAAARSARYAALEGVAQREGAAAVLLGHTRDDQAETVLLGLARGSGARSLAGMAESRDLWRRPFLTTVARADTEAACRALGLDPWQDPTNDLPTERVHEAPLRTRVRHQVLPVLEDVLGPGVADALARSAEQLREDADALDRLAEQEWERLGGGTEAEVDALARLPVALRRRVLRRMALAAGCPAGALHRAHVVALDALVTDWHGQGAVALPGGRRGSRACGRLTLVVP